MFYLIVFLIVTLLAALNIARADKSGNRILVGLAAMLLVLIAGLRYETGGDWDVYQRIFYSIPPINQINPLQYNNPTCEIGFCLLCALIKWLGGGLQTLFFVVTLFDILFITLALCRYTKYPVLGLLCYYGILYFQLDMIYIRQAMTVAICFWAIHCIEDKQPIRYFLWILLACLIHKVAIVMVILYPLVRLKFPMWVYIFVIVVGMVIMLVGIPWITSIFASVTSFLGGSFAEKAAAYSQDHLFAVSRKLSTGFVLNVAIIFVVLFFKNDIEKRRYGTLHLNMFTLSLVCYYYGYELVEISNRFRFFFLISIIALLPNLVEAMHTRLKIILSGIIVILYSFSISMGIFLESPAAVAYNPYQNYIVYQYNGKSSTGKQRLEQSHHAFNIDRKR